MSRAVNQLRTQPREMFQFTAGNFFVVPDSFIPERLAIYDRYRHRLAYGRVEGGILMIRIVSGEELKATLEELGALSAVAERYAMTPVTARKVLNDHGLALDQRLVAEWDAGASLDALSRRHGPKPETISGWLKDAGAVIPSGNHRRTVTREELIAAHEELKSIGKAAKAVGIARNTASKWLVEAGKASARKHSK